jgi:YbbR domain-containing protein
MLREIFIKDWGWKSFSLLLAALIWLTVHKIVEEPKVSPALSGSTLTIGTLPVFIVASAADVHLYRVEPNTVSVMVSGAPDDIAELKSSQIRATVDLTGIDAGRDLKRRVDVSVPSGITLVSVDPPKVDVVIPPPMIKQP